MSKSGKKKPKKNFRKFWKLGVDEWNTGIFDVSKQGNLVINEGHHVYDVDDLVRKFGSPLQIILPFVIEDRVKDLIGYFQAYMKIYGYKGKFHYHYPMKANQNKEFVLPILSEGANLETSSANELWIVKKIWENGKFNERIRVFCNGAKTEAYLDLIEELRGKGMNVVPIIESMEEVDRLSKYKGDVGVRVDIAYRADTHWDKKFDRFGLSEREVLELPKMKNLKIMHYHMGSQIKTQKSILGGVKYAFGIYTRLQKKQPTVDTLNIGSGFGLPYEKKQYYTAKVVSSKIIKLLKNLADKAEIKHPNLAIEWGQYIVAPSQVTVYKIISEKKIEKANAKAWYIIDGSFMNDLKDTWAIHQKWHIIPANNMTGSCQSVWLAGTTCDSDDKYTAGGEYVLLPKMVEGKDQYIAVLDTGAYQDPMSSHHCLLALPMKVSVADGIVKIVRKRETPEIIAKKFGWNGDTK